MFETLQAVSAAYSATGAQRIWWRGHSDARWKLQPSIYHRGMRGSEKQMFARFMQMAPAIESSLHGEQEIINWLYVMQHHGLPTRLLDWTESPLVAMYFCVSHSISDDVDGAIWWLEPTTLNHVEFGESELFGPGTTEAQAILRAVVRPNAEDVAQSKIAALLVNRSDRRHLIQHAQCTVHGREQPLEECGCGLLSKIVIPADKKADIRNWLEMLQVNRQTLFPDLDNLAKYIADGSASI